LHYTYLATSGQKASVEKPRKLSPGAIPKGGAVRLFNSAETMGIAEGIETALSAAQLFDVPVWAATNADLMRAWVPPKTAKCIIVFGDNDSSFTGQEAAWSLARRLKLQDYHVDVRIPELPDTDWNDVVMTQ
jgi:putative DNA primase/helicase